MGYLDAMTVEIRDEAAADKNAIYNVTKRAFRDMDYAGGDEQDIVNRLRDQGALSVSLVAVKDGILVGHVAFSPAGSADSTGPWFTLGPVSVLPAEQRRGIGSALIERGLADLRDQGAAGCILTGNPDYYRRFGFEVSPDNSPDSAYEDFFMILPFSAVRPVGRMSFHAAFG